MAFDNTWTTLAAAVIIGAIVAVGIGNVFTALGIEEVDRAQVDARRMAEAVEVLDHSPGTAVRLSFEQSYGSIDLSGGEVTFEKNGETVSEDLHLAGSAGGSLSGVDHVCVVKQVGEPVTLRENCDAVETGTLDMQDSETYDGSQGGTGDGWVRLFADQDMEGERVELDETVVDLSTLEPSWDGRPTSLQTASGHQVRLYQNVDRTGKYLTASGEVDTLLLNDNVLTVNVAGGNACTATLYTNGYRRGADGSINGDPGKKMTVAGESTQIHGFGANIRSAEVIGPERCYAEFYSESDTQGNQCYAIGAAQSETSCNQVTTDQRDPSIGSSGRAPLDLSSVAVSGGDTCRVRVYQQENFGGNNGEPYLTLAGETETLHWPRDPHEPERMWANGVSAVRVDEGCMATVYQADKTRGYETTGRTATLVGETTALGIGGDSITGGNGISSLEISRFER